MVHLRSTRAAIVLLLSLIALEDYAALPRRDIAAYCKSHEELGGETTTIVGTSREKWLRGRMMVVEEVKAARSTANTGNAKTSSSESLESSITEETSINVTPNCKNEASDSQGKPKAFEASSGHASLGSSAGSKLSAPTWPHDSFQSTRKQNLREATTEIFKMLNRDYHNRPRRHPPVHN
ncbi:unnamed protein product [Musa acuminata subsp. burmannicoides]